MSDFGHGERGGWITFPYITAGVVGVTVAGGGCLANIIVYMIEEFQVKSIDAAQILNVFGGSACLVPVAGAVIADSFWGCFSVIWVSSSISLLGAVLLTLTATIDSLRPQPLTLINGASSPPSSAAVGNPASKFQLAILYAGINLTSIGVGGMRFTIATMGANQFQKPKDRGVFFNWYLVVLYTSVVFSSTVVVYIEDNLGWAWGFSLCIAANALGLAVFVIGNRRYRHVKPQGSPFTGLARVLVAAYRKRKLPVSSEVDDYYHGADVVAATPSKSFKYLNRAALKDDGDIEPDGSIAKPWRLCSVQQVEDLKTLIRIFPLWSTGIFLSTPLRFLSSLIILQALTMDRRVGPHFKIPAGSMLVFVLASTAISLTVIDRFVLPVWQRLAGRPPKVLQRIGVGHVLNVVGMAVAAMVESDRLRVARRRHLQELPEGTVPMVVLWLVLQMAAVGIGEAFHYPGQVAFYYQEFPAALRSTATAMVAMHMGIAYYLSTAVIDLIRRITRWLPNDDINKGRLDNVYWMLTVAGVLNFGYFLACARLYNYRNVETGDATSGHIHNNNNNHTNGIGHDHQEQEKQELECN
ncbi:protein NRT1/ PTR FAMILY 2.7 [Malania oleifera]|uniref:protein NRT1/ PTR FAMILY 2.7 n=1 Tax=Malania oleifera TaxID=397392 RepID=UPI0025AEBFB3|nr:protein NRT1/ PTR FAMILY 2.7 [Malania oleifera]